MARMTAALIPPERLTLPARDVGHAHYRARWTRGPLMEAEALTTDTWSMQDAPENERAVPDTLNDNHQQTEPASSTFRDLRVAEPICAALDAAGITTAFPIQALALPRQGHLDLSQGRGRVLDEADKMLDLGFLPDVEKILRLTPDQRQTMLFSATMPGEVVTLARRHLRRPTHVRAEHHDEPVLVPSTEQHVFRAHQMDKIEVLARVLQAEGRGLTIVFCRTKRACDQVASALTTRGFAAAAVHGDLGQGQRERAMRAFRSGKVDVLVATDVAARGLDVDDVTHVVNYA